jgi:hypothetical protein
VWLDRLRDKDERSGDFSQLSRSFLVFRTAFMPNALRRKIEQKALALLVRNEQNVLSESQTRYKDPLVILFAFPPVRMYSEHFDPPKLLAGTDVGRDHKAGLAITAGRILDAFPNDGWNWFRRNSFCKTLWADEAEQNDNNRE